MEKRNQKLKNCLQMIELRLKGKKTLQRVEIELDDQKQVLQADPENPLYLLRGQERIRLENLASFLEEKLISQREGRVKIEERGNIINLQLLPGEVKMTFDTRDQPDARSKTPEPGTRQDFIPAAEARDLLQTLGLMTPQGRIKADRRRKYYQIDRFVELINEILEEQSPTQPLTILDCGCGKSYLSFVLNYWLTERQRIPCRIIGIDSDPQVIDSSRNIQKKLGYHNMEFHQNEIVDFVPSSSVDMLLSLHACDTATDAALALGIHLQSRYIITVPCCQASLHDRIDLRSWEPITKHGLFHNQLADVFTDGLRAAALESYGYRVSVVEYVSPLDTPRNIMLRAVSGYPQPGSRKNYQQLRQKVAGEIPLEKYLQDLEYRNSSF